MPKSDLSTAFIMEHLKNSDTSRYRELITLRTKHPDDFQKRLEIIRKEVTPQDLTHEETPIQRERIFEDLDFDIDHVEEDIIYLSDNDFPLLFNYKELQTLTRRTWREKNKLIFYIDRETCLKGKVTNEIRPYKQKLVVARRLKSNSDTEAMEKISFFHKKEDARRWRTEDFVSGEFWAYQFESSHRSYILLSRERLDLEHCVVEGTLVELQDNLPIGTDTKINVGLPTIFVHTVHKSKPTFKSKEELIQKTAELGLTHEKYFNFLFSAEHKTLGKKTFNHPDYFQYLISAFLLSAIQEYPLHLLIIARLGSGKSTLEDAVWKKFDEETDIVEGSCSTFKVLIPSFKGNLPDAGAIVKSNRIAVIDEFLRILMRVHKDDRQAQLAALNPILEHRKRRVGSGNGTIMLSPSARVLAVTNPVWGTGSMDLLCDHIDTSFISRLLTWYQDKGHIKLVEEQETLEDTYFDIDKHTWLGIVDYLHSFISDYDLDVVNQFFNEGLELLGEDNPDNVLQEVISVYTGRYRHHLSCLLDGIVKTRCICTGDPSFKALDQDYDTLAVIWYRMLVSWGLPINALDKSLLNTKIYGKSGG